MYQFVLKRGERGTSSLFFFLKLVLQIKGKSGQGDADVKAAVCVFVVSLSHLKWVVELSGCHEGTCVLSKTGICAPISLNTHTMLSNRHLIKIMYSSSVFRGVVSLDPDSPQRSAVCRGNTALLFHQPCRVLYADVSRNRHERFLGKSVALGGGAQF